jgi:hypothetical protein
MLPEFTCPAVAVMVAPDVVNVVVVGVIFVTLFWLSLVAEATEVA